MQSQIKDLRIHPSNIGGWHGLYTDLGFSSLVSGNVWGMLGDLPNYVPARMLNGIISRTGWLVMTNDDTIKHFGQDIGSYVGITFTPHSTSSHLVVMGNDKWNLAGTVKASHELMHCISDEYPLWGGSGNTLDNSAPFIGPWQKIVDADIAGTINRAGLYAWSNNSEFLAVAWEYYSAYKYYLSIGNSSAANSYLSLLSGVWTSTAGITQTERDAMTALFDSLNVPLTLPPLPPGYTILT